MTLDANDVLREGGPDAVRRLHDGAKRFQPKCQPATINGAPIARAGQGKRNSDVLYNADAIEYSDADLPVLLVPRDEFEAAENIFDSHAVSAVTGPLTPLDLFKGRHVVIWPQDLAEQLAARIKAAGATEIRMVQIPADWPADWTIRRGAHDPEVRQMLRGRMRRQQSGAR